jgi:hypothetical protein
MRAGSVRIPCLIGRASEEYGSTRAKADTIQSIDLGEGQAELEAGLSAAKYVAY